MSVAEQAPTAVRRPKARVSPRFFLSELRLMLGRRRNQAGLLVLAAVPVLISISVKSSLSQPGRDAPDFFRSITDNGLFVALAALTIEIGLFLPLAVSVVAGDSVAGEANLGTLRYLLTVPVTRLRLLLVKLAAIAVGAFTATFVVAVTGAVMGLALFGGGSMTLLSGTQIGFGEGMLRVALAAAYIACGLTALGAVGLFISTLTEQPIAATIATVVFSTSSFILDSIPQVSWLHPYLLTHHWLDFGDLLRDPVAWHNVLLGLYLAVGYVVVFSAAGSEAGRDPGDVGVARALVDRLLDHGPDVVAGDRLDGAQRLRRQTLRDGLDLLGGEAPLQHAEDRRVVLGRDALGVAGPEPVEDGLAQRGRLLGHGGSALRDEGRVALLEAQLLTVAGRHDGGQAQGDPAQHDEEAQPGDRLAERPATSYAGRRGRGPVRSRRPESRRPDADRIQHRQARAEQEAVEQDLPDVLEEQSEHQDLLRPRPGRTSRGPSSGPPSRR
jgi:ABC-2 type transport system permease protein